jgi:hypothetical protein
MSKKEPVERLIANIPRDLKRKTAAKAAMQGVTLTEILIEFLEGYTEGFEVSGFEENDEEDEPELALAA